MATAIIRCKYSVQCLYSLRNLQHLHLFSTKSPNDSIKSPNQSCSNYLVNNLGFSHQQALSISTKLHYKYADYSKFSDNANSVVDFLKQHDFDDTHVIKVVSCYPKILACNVDETLKPKFNRLQDHGFSGSDLVTLFSSSPSLVYLPMDRIIYDLRDILGSNENLIKLFKRSKLVSNSTLEDLVSNVAMLINEYGIDIKLIQNSILLRPGSFMRKSEFFRNVLIGVEEYLGIPRNSGMFLYGMHLLCNSSKQRIESKCQLLKFFGWTEFDVSELMRRSPNTFLISEENIRKKLGFFMTELGYKPDFLATHPALLGYSIEKRVAPRHRVLLVLKEKGLLDYNLYTAAIKTEKRFLKILIEPFKGNVPGLLELYQKSKGCSKVDAISN